MPSLSSPLTCVYRRAYCSDDCQHSDLSSPSISSSSSALSSPSLGYAVGGDVPALVPSALGSALKMYAQRTGYRVASSISSSSCGVATDDEDEEDLRPFVSGDFGSMDPSDPDFGLKSPQLLPSALSYARRPSGTNNPYAAPHLHRRTSSSMSPRHMRGYPRSAPISSSTLVDDDETFSDIGFSSWDGLDTDDVEIYSEKDWDATVQPKYSGEAKSKRTRNRASLPACFSLLQKMASPSKDARSSPVSSSSANTIARPSPPTPKLSLVDALAHVHIATSGPLTSVHTTPRGRRREADKSRSSRRSGSSHSRSRSRRVYAEGSPIFSEGPKFVPPEEEPFDWVAAAELPRRGREALRRNSSPPPKLPTGMESSSPIFLATRRTQETDRSKSRGSSRARTRGRARVEDLGGIGFSTDAPGFGYGRSGLLDRERGAGSHIARVPL